MEYLVEILAAAWPFLLVLGLLWIVHTLRETLRPVIEELIKALANQARTSAGLWVIAFLFGLSASLAAVYDLFQSLDVATLKAMSWAQHVALWAKVFNPFIVAMLARLVPQAPVKNGLPGGTQPPFSAPNP